MEPLATVALDVSASVPIVRIAGEIDLSNVGDIETALRSLVDQGGRCGRLVVDLSDVVYLDSTGLRMLETTGRDVQQQAIAFTLVVPKESYLRRLFEITGIGHRFEVAERWGDFPPNVPGSDPR